MFVLALLILAACTQDDARRVIVDAGATSTPVVSEPTLAALPAVDGTEWREIETGLFYQEIELEAGSMQVIRADPSVFDIRVAYDVSAPGRVSEWQKALDAAAIINGGYFDKQGRATALTIFDGVQQGASYEGFGGMLSVDGSGAVSVRSLRDHPYDESEQLTQALQSAPMLVIDGERVPQPNDDGERDRRSVVAIDQDGFLLLLFSNRASLSLSELSRWLVEQPFGIVNALNLDGGSSSGLALKSPSLEFTTDSLVRVPQVLVVARR